MGAERRVRDSGPVAPEAFAALVEAGEPVVLRGQCAAWPLASPQLTDAAFCAAIAAHATPEPAQLWVAPPAIGGRYGFDAALEAENFERKLAPLADICALVLRAAQEPGAPGLFAGGVGLPAHAPGLLAQLPMPLLPAERHRLTSLWIGTPSHTATHWDLPDNLACVLRGGRRFVLFAPDEIGNLYLGPIDRTLAGQPTSLVDATAPDFDRFPRYRGALERAMVADLAPGDALFIPSLWFHQVQSGAPVGAQVNFWWRANDAQTLSPLSSLLHALLTLRDLPAREKAGWRAFFDHYVFGDAEAAAAHIPPPARGVLARLDSAGQRDLAARLVQELAGWHNSLL